jgi:N-acetylmuramoyl-L-alanine amidase
LHSHLALAAACGSKAPEDVAIVVDVGHVAKQPGMRCELMSRVPCPWGETSARGVPEYDFNLALAQQIKDELVGSGFRSTYLMTAHIDGKEWLAAGPEQQREWLQQKNLGRASRADNMNADIFLSVHHDGVRDQYLKPWMYQGQQHFYFDDSKGFSLHIPHLSQGSARYRESLGLAQGLADQLLKAGLGFNTVHQTGNPVGAGVPFADAGRGIYERVDHLAVLSYTKMPALLLEAGVIVNRDEELTLSTPEFRATIAAAVAEAVKKFCGGGGSKASIIKTDPDDRN